jgi:molybdopterin/thiamine biosynthesis adenylyltransferase
MGSATWRYDIQRAAVDKTFPDGAAYRSLARHDATLLARHHQVAVRDIEIEALSMEIVPEPYVRNLNTFSMADQRCLLTKTAAVVGLGGLGGVVVEILARIGVGALTLMDGDIFDSSNLNRQLCSRVGNLGGSKAVAAAERVGEINPGVNVRAHHAFLTAANASNLLGRPDVVVDCLDTIQARFILQDAAKRLAVPMVSAAIAGENGQVMTILPGDAGLAQIYGPAQQAPQRGVETTLGNLPTTVFSVAALEARETIKLLLNQKPFLSQRLLIADLRDYTIEKFAFSNSGQE